MKKKIVCLFMAVCCLALSACGSLGDKKDTDTSVISDNVVYSFNEPIFDVKMSSDFGKVQLNADKRFVKVGNKSLKLIPLKDAKYPYVYFPFFSSYVNSVKNNLNKLHSIGLDIYAEDSVKIGVGLYFTKKADSRTPTEVFELVKGWNHVDYNVNLSILELFGDLKKFCGVYVAYETDDRPSIYVDNISVKDSKTEIPFTSLIDIDNSGNGVLISDFERDVDAYLFSSKGTAALPSPEISVVKASDCGCKNATSGTKVLRVKPSVKSLTDIDRTDSFLFFAEAYMRAIEWSKYANNLKNYEFKFDVYTKCTNNDESLFGLYIDYGTNFSGWTISATCKTNQWTTCSVSLNALADYIKDCKNLAFRYEDGFDTTREFYIDNVRIEPKSSGQQQTPSTTWNSFDDGDCVLESFNSTWYDEFDGEHGVIEFCTATLKTRQFRPKNFKSLYSSSNYQNGKYLKIRAKSNTHFAFAMIYEAKWKTVSFNNYKKAVGEWNDYYINMSDFLPMLDYFNDNPLLRIDSDTTYGKVWISDISVVDSMDN